MATKNGDKPSSTPTTAQVVIIGGGVIGCSVAYHLAKRGWRDVVLLEKHKLTSGTTWHAAGLIATSGFTTETGVELAKYTRDLYRNLEAETGFATGFNPVGLLQVAASKGTLEDLRRKATFNKYMGIESEEISPAEVKAMWPLARTDDILAGFFAPHDGRANPVDVTIALSKGAKAGGVSICEGVNVTGVTQKNGRVTGVTTSEGAIQAEFVVNCAGMWGREIGLMAGVTVPLQSAEHYYIILEGIDGIHRDLPILEDPDVYGYFREEGGGMMVGLFEPIGVPWALDGIPEPFTFGELEPDLDRMMPYLQTALERIPAAQDARVRQFFCGPESFAPDLSPIVGEAPELQNFFVAAGLNSLGILTAGGVGRLVANWIVDGLPDMDVNELNIDRFQRFDATRAFRRDRTVEILGEMYKVHYPGKGADSARGVRRHVLHDRLTQAGACFVQSAGWEIADWYAPAGVKAEVTEYTWGRPPFFEWAAEEHRACREDVILMDMSFMSKFIVQGRDALECLNWVSCNDLDVPVDRIVYTQWTNVQGGIEADLTITRVGRQEFMVVCSDTAHRHVETWMRRNFPEDAHVTITDVTSGRAMLTIQGPKSRALLTKVTGEDMSNESFPYLSGREMEIDYSVIYAVRVTYLGELGWLAVAAKLRHWSARDIAEIVRLFTISGQDFLDEWFEDERVKGALGTQTILGAWCGPMSPGSAYVLLHHWIGEVNGRAGAWGWVHGGMGALSQCFADSALDAGATIRASEPVRRVVIENGKATGVELEDGTLLRAKQVISTAHPTTTYMDLIGEENLSEEVVRDIGRYRTKSGSVKVNLGLSELPKPSMWKGAIPGAPHTGIFAISPSLEYLERAWDDAKYGRISEHPYIEAVFPTVFEPNLAPNGKHIMLCFTQFGPFELRDGSWDTEREVYGNRVIQTIAEYCPGFEDSVEHIEVLAPPDIEERYGLLGGNIMQGEMAVDQMFSFRPIPGYGDYRTPIKGLYLCGGGTHPGGGVTGAPARNCAKVVAKDRRRLRG